MGARQEQPPLSSHCRSGAQRPLQQPLKSNARPPMAALPVEGGREGELESAVTCTGRCYTWGGLWLLARNVSVEQPRRTLKHMLQPQLGTVTHPQR